MLPFSSLTDYRFDWLKNEFLPYFQQWLQSIQDRPGNFTPNARSNMFISWQTYEGIKITVNSVVELVKYLLSHNVSYVITEKFCQDPLENYFGRQRSMGARKDNPSVRDFGYNDNSIRNQKIFRPIQGGNSSDHNAALEKSVTNQYLARRENRLHISDGITKKFYKRKSLYSIISSNKRLFL